jgi:hypothetical protein
MSQATPPAERRRTPRRQPALGTVLRLSDVALSERDRETVALVWNISLGGVSFLYPRPFPPGTHLQAELVSKRSSEKTAVPIGLRVRHCFALQTGDYLLGCQFDQPISPEQMSHFVDEALLGL